MRISNIRRIHSKTLTVGLASHVEGSVHVGAYVTATGPWVVQGSRDMTGTCHTGHKVECGMFEQVRVFRRLLGALSDQMYTGDLTVLTAAPGLEKLLQDWRSGHRPEFPWYKCNLRPLRERVQSYKGAITVITLTNGGRPLVELAGSLSKLVSDGMWGLHDREFTMQQAERLVADWRKE
jgi:hypothetical protein